jgi:hypothetical protein
VYRKRKVVGIITAISLRLAVDFERVAGLADVGSLRT